VRNDEEPDDVDARGPYANLYRVASFSTNECRMGRFTRFYDSYKSKIILLQSVTLSCYLVVKWLSHTLRRPDLISSSNK
jgi:hypothetical protein